MNREYPLGFHMGSVAPGEIVSVTTKPSQTFHASRLVIPSFIATKFELVMVRVAGIDQKVPPGSCSRYNEMSREARIELTTIPKGVACELVVRNTTDAPADFVATLLGQCPDVEGSTGQ